MCVCLCMWIYQMERKKIAKEKYISIPNGCDGKFIKSKQIIGKLCALNAVDCINCLDIWIWSICNFVFVVGFFFCLKISLSHSLFSSIDNKIQRIKMKKIKQMISKPSGSLGGKKNKRTLNIQTDAHQTTRNAFDFI